MSGLEVRDVSVAFDTTQALDAVSLDVETGRILAVLGPSGCGKSTLLRVIAGLQQPGSGQVLFDGQDVTGVPTHRRGFALMFQDGQLFEHLSVSANVAYPLRRQGVSRREASERARELLDLVGLTGFADRAPRTLSGGQQQRVALARALAAQPRLLLLDEPLSALDRDLRERLAIDLRQILLSTGTTALLVTHDHSEAFTLADDAVLLRAGRVVQHGEVADLWRGPVDEEAARFLGYGTILTGEPAIAVRQALQAPGDGPVALRRGALRVSTGSGQFAGVAGPSAYAADEVTVEVDLPALGRVPVTAEVAPPEGARLGVDLLPARVAFLNVHRTAT
ncbi:ABC transporter ATP-binding protein [Branchiibius sp. NY16-3462-2]|uniref:ABC transporter ATP-binding protein n=1 Tax=Branchiibius sp. NY16-3462-2 TaxID=1807500 RepID=UPI00079C700E|nr:ABC transporter ATP-binding protein [Branchiibius sp. NY16-3462-2]KYH43410.1 hypothetical protein AZH51_16760 [Branchiibius sp. NY16-3462-2]